MSLKYRKNNVRELELLEEIDALLKSIRLNFPLTETHIISSGQLSASTPIGAKIQGKLSHK